MENREVKEQALRDFIDDVVAEQWKWDTSNMDRLVEVLKTTDALELLKGMVNP